jgi:hypothetical protein
MKRPSSPQLSFHLLPVVPLLPPLPAHRLVLWREANHVHRKHLPLAVGLQVLLFGRVRFGSW